MAMFISHVQYCANLLLHNSEEQINYKLYLITYTERSKELFLLATKACVYRQMGSLSLCLLIVQQKYSSSIIVK